VARLLIVEDDIDQVRVLRDLFSSVHEVAAVRRGEDAVELARAFRPEVVILDLTLPGMDGIETGLWLKRSLTPEPRILVMTGLAGPTDRAAVLSSGCCDAYLAKPTSLARVRAAVAMLLAPEAGDERAEPR
jgi:two-component system, cell cycle response regulator DivK